MKKTLTKSTVAVNNITNLPPKPLIGAALLQALFDKAGADDKIYTNALIDELQSETLGTSGSFGIGHNSANITAKNVGDSLIELTTALGNDPNFATSIAALLALKAPLASPNFTGTPLGLVKAHVGLANVDNTADMDKPVSTIQQTALNLKANDTAVAHLTGNETLTGIKTFSASPIVPTPTTPTQASPKGYVDASIGAVVLGQIPDNALTEIKMAPEMKKQAGGVAPFDTVATKANLSTLLTSSLVAATWTGATAPFSYVLAVAGVTATSNQEILPTITITAAELLALQSANIVDGGQAAGSITLLAYGTKPTIAIPIRVIRRGDIA